MKWEPHLYQNISDCMYSYLFVSQDTAKSVPFMYLAKTDQGGKQGLKERTVKICTVCTALSAL